MKSLWKGMAASAPCASGSIPAGSASPVLRGGKEVPNVIGGRMDPDVAPPVGILRRVSKMFVFRPEATHAARAAACP